MHSNAKSVRGWVGGWIESPPGSAFFMEHLYPRSNTFFPLVFLSQLQEHNTSPPLFFPFNLIFDFQLLWMSRVATGVVPEVDRHSQRASIFVRILLARALALPTRQVWHKKNIGTWTLPLFKLSSLFLLHHKRSSKTLRYHLRSSCGRVRASIGIIVKGREPRFASL